MAEATAETPTITLTRNQRYHLLNREERLRKQREKYNSDPAVIARREEKERLKAVKEAERKAVKEAEKEAKKEERRQQKQLELQEKIKIAAATKKVRKTKSEIDTEISRQACDDLTS